MRSPLSHGLVFALALALSAPLLARGSELPHQRDRAYEHWQEGYLLHSLGAYEEAVEAYRKSIELRPTAEGHTFLGWSLSMLGRLDEAIVECKRAIAFDPDYGNPYNDIGVYLIELGRPDEAIADSHQSSRRLNEAASRSWRCRARAAI